MVKLKSFVDKNVFDEQNIAPIHKTNSMVLFAMSLKPLTESTMIKISLGFRV